MTDHKNSLILISTLESIDIYGTSDSMGQLCGQVQTLVINIKEKCRKCVLFLSIFYCYFRTIPVITHAASANGLCTCNVTTQLHPPKVATLSTTDRNVCMPCSVCIYEAICHCGIPVS